MNLHQFRFVQEAVRRDLNLTETAKALFTSQPGVSKAILELEGELGVDIFARHGKRLRRVTEPGREVLKAIEVIMREVGNLKRIGEEFSKQDAGTLSIATTHSQARYFLPAPIAQMRKRFPKVNISLHQGTPEQVAQDGLRGSRRFRPGDRIARRLRRSRHPALLRLAARAGAAGRPPAGAARPSLDRGPGAAAADLVPPVVLGPKAHRRRPSRRASWCPTSSSRRSMPT